MRAPIMTADDFGMAPWWFDPAELGEPQTARSDGSPRLPADLLRVDELDALDDTRLHYARRMAADAVDHLIALMDAIDARTTDLEPQNEDGDPLDVGEGDPLEDAEDDDPGEDDGTAEPSLGAPEQHDGTVYRRDGRWFHEPASQISWARGCDDDRELGDDNGIADQGGIFDQYAAHV